MRRRRSEFGGVFMNSPAAVRQSECGRRRRRLKVILCGSAHYIYCTHYYSEPKSGVLFGIIPVYYWLVVVIILCAYVHTSRERKSHRAFSCRSTDRAAGAVGWRVKFIISAGVNIIVRRQPKVLRDPNDFIIEGFRYKYNNTMYIFVVLICYYCFHIVC